MKTRHIAIVSPLMAAVLAAPVLLTQGSTPPLAAKKPHTTQIHGMTLHDQYFWLREKRIPRSSRISRARIFTLRR